MISSKSLAGADAHVHALRSEKLTGATRAAQVHERNEARRSARNPEDTVLLGHAPRAPERATYARDGRVAASSGHAQQAYAGGALVHEQGEGGAPGASSLVVGEDAHVHVHAHGSAAGTIGIVAGEGSHVHVHSRTRGESTGALSIVAGDDSHVHVHGRAGEGSGGSLQVAEGAHVHVHAPVRDGARTPSGAASVDHSAATQLRARQAFAAYAESHGPSSGPVPRAAARAQEPQPQHPEPYGEAAEATRKHEADVAAGAQRGRKAQLRMPPGHVRTAYLDPKLGMMQRLVNATMQSLERGAKVEQTSKQEALRADESHVAQSPEDDPALPSFGRLP